MWTALLKWLLPKANRQLESRNSMAYWDDVQQQAKNSVMDMIILIILWTILLSIGRTLMDSEKHEIMFQGNNKEITFKVGKGHLSPKSYRNTLVIEDVDVEDDFH
ncbi:hypothetical protein HAX54_013991, partial [Datura stramonium]|nr:hypothetical protein [Datura stramonium]